MTLLTLSKANQNCCLLSDNKMPLHCVWPGWHSRTCLAPLQPESKQVNTLAETFNLWSSTNVTLFCCSVNQKTFLVLWAIYGGAFLCLGVSFALHCLLWVCRPFRIFYYSIVLRQKCSFLIEVDPYLMDGDYFYLTEVKCKINRITFDEFILVFKSKRVRSGITSSTGCLASNKDNVQHGNQPAKKSVRKRGSPQV